MVAANFADNVCDIGAICDTLTNTCGANDVAKATCARAAAAASAATKNSGAQADAFNAVFGITTVSNPLRFACLHLLKALSTSRTS